MSSIPRYESESEGWLQLQRCAAPLLTALVAKGVLNRFEMSVWLAVAGQMTVKSGTAGVTCVSLAEDFRVHLDTMAVALKNLELAGVLLRVQLGEYQPNPWLIRSGGPGRHALLFQWFHERWQRRHGPDSKPPDPFELAGCAPPALAAS